MNLLTPAILPRWAKNSPSTGKKTKPTLSHHKGLVVAAVESRLPLQRDGVVGGGDELEDARAVGPARLEYDEVVAVGAQAVVHDAPVTAGGKDARRLSNRP